MVGNTTKRCIFKSCECGNAALAFCLALVPMVGAAGMALDLQSAGNSRHILQVEADAAALDVMRAAASIHTGAATASRTDAERSAMIDAKAAHILATRRAAAQARPSGLMTNLVFSGKWDDALKTEYTFIASGTVKRYFTIPGIGERTLTMQVQVSATAKMEVETSFSTAVPTLINPGHEAADYNRLYAYCYDSSRKNETGKGRSKMTPVSSNGVSGAPEMQTNSAFRNVQMPVCEGREVLSWRLYNIRGQRMNARAWPEDTYDGAKRLWSQTDQAGYDIHNHYSDTRHNRESGLEEHAFTGAAFGLNAPIKLMETVVCETMDQCTPGKPGAVIPSGKNRAPHPQNMPCAPGRFMYMGWEDRPFLRKSATAGDYSPTNSHQWTDSDYDDITLVIACPETRITGYRTRIWLVR